MSVYLVTGYSGSGKSSIAREMQRRGLPAFDTDSLPELTRWEDVKTGQQVDEPQGYVDFSKVSWNWNAPALQKLIAENKSLFLCGSASNQERFYGLFDKVFVLKLSKEAQAKRIKARPEHDFGQHPKQLQEIINKTEEFVNDLVEQGATPVNAEPTVKDVVDDIVSQTNDA